MAKKRKRTRNLSAPKPEALSTRDKQTLARILKKARAFKAYYSAQRQSGT